MTNQWLEWTLQDSYREGRSAARREGDAIERLLADLEALEQEAAVLRRRLLALTREAGAGAEWHH